MLSPPIGGGTHTSLVLWYCAQLTVTRLDPNSCSHCGSIHNQQETDVLVLGFLRFLAIFHTGWPEKNPWSDNFYPTTMMETGYDILFFWVARMIMMGLEFTGEVPFKTVYLHGLIRDEKGVKMSKTKGNVIAPLTVMEEMGTDALRFSLLVGSTPGNDMSLSLKKVEANRNFANKTECRSLRNWQSHRVQIPPKRNLSDIGWFLIWLDYSSCNWCRSIVWNLSILVKLVARYTVCVEWIRKIGT